MNDNKSLQCSILSDEIDSFGQISDDKPLITINSISNKFTQIDL